MIQINSITYQADIDKVWKRKNSDFIGGNLIIIGCNDSIENYEQINKPVEVAE